MHQLRVDEIQNFGDLLGLGVSYGIRYVVHDVAERSSWNFEVIRPKLDIIGLRVLIVKQQHFVNFVNENPLVRW